METLKKIKRYTISSIITLLVIFGITFIFQSMTKSEHKNNFEDMRKYDTEIRHLEAEKNPSKTKDKIADLKWEIKEKEFAARENGYKIRRGKWIQFYILYTIFMLLPILFLTLSGLKKENLK